MSPQSSPEILSSRVPALLEEALVKLRHDDHQLHFGHDDHPWCWDLGQGLGITLLRTATRDAPARLAATATASATALPDACFQSTPSSPPPPPPLPTAATNPTGNHTGQPVALCDFLARRLHAAIAAASPAASSHGIRSDYDSEAVGQFVLETNRAAVSAATGAVSVVFEVLPARGGGSGGARQLRGGAQEQQQDRGRGAEMVDVLRGIVKQALLGSVHPGGGLDAAAARAHVESVEDQRHLRRLVAASDGVAFVADGCVLPRRGGSDDRPMEISRGAVPFRSPESLRREFRLPHRGVVKGMLVPRGVTVIVGGGYHGKSTLLRALAVGVYDKVPGDGRELAVADPGAVTIRAEDGRPVSAVDISPFISSLPSAVAAPPVRAAPAGGVASAAASESTAAPGGGGAVGGAEGGTAETNGGSGSGGGGEGVTTERFSTGAASGSTSQAANVVEALEAGATALLLDEDTCAGNFMIRDSRMRAMVSHEPITPFIYRVSSLWLELGVSSVIVVGGCGDYFDVHDTALLVDNYVVSDATERAHSISRRFCVGRVQYAGRGLVHRLPWPGDPQPRAVVPESVLLRLAAAVGAGSNVKRKREGHGRGDDGGVGVVEKSSDSGGDGWRRQTDSTSNGDRSYDESTITGNTKRDRWNPGPPQAEDACPCYCGRGQRGGSRGPPADLSRVGQLVGGGGMERGCALGVDFVARETERSPGFLSVSGALDLLDAATGCGGGRGSDGGLGLEALFVRDTGVAAEGRDTQQATAAEAATANSILGGPLVALPRRFEVAAALHRFPGVQFRSAAPVTPEDDREETVPTEGVEEGEAT